MLVNVKTETKINTPADATLVRCSVLHELNRVERLSALQKKTCFNPSKGGRIQLPISIVVDTHHRRSWREGYMLAFITTSGTLEMLLWHLHSSPPKGGSILEVLDGKV